MTETLTSSVPGIYNSLLALVTAAGKEQTPEVPTFAFQVIQNEPPRYILVTDIKGPRWEWESIGGVGLYAMKEIYDVVGKATVFNGNSPGNEPSVAGTVLQETWNLFQTCVMAPLISHRNAPVLGNEVPTRGSVYLMIPLEASYSAGPGNVGGGPAGWVGQLDWAFHFEAKINSE